LPKLPADTSPAVDLTAITVQHRLAADEALMSARNRLFDTLTPEQAGLFSAYKNAVIGEAYATQDFYVAEIAHPFPAIALPLSRLWPHVTEYDTKPDVEGWCFRPSWLPASATAGRTMT
jgi:hypothetical protein